MSTVLRLQRTRTSKLFFQRFRLGDTAFGAYTSLDAEGPDSAPTSFLKCKI
jgi:hypothetical protein